MVARVCYLVYMLYLQHHLTLLIGGGHVVQCSIPDLLTK